MYIYISICIYIFVYWVLVNNRAPTGQPQPGNRAIIPTGRPSLCVSSGNRALTPTGQQGNNSNRAAFALCLNRATGH